MTAASRDRMIAVVLFVAGALAVLEINDSPRLPAAQADSVQYMEAAKSLIEGRGLTVPMVRWDSPDSTVHLSDFPPGPSLEIASVMWLFDVRADVAALWLLALAGGATLVLVFGIVARVEGAVAGVVSALAVGLLPPVVFLQANIWSELLYLPPLLLTLWLLGGQRPRPILAGLAAAITVATRYMGLATVAAVGISTYWRTRSVAKATLSIFPGALVFVPWWLRARTDGGSAGAWGDFAVPLSETLRQVPEAVEFWLAPEATIWVALLVLLCLALCHAAADRELARPIWLLAGAHIGLIVATRLFLLERVPLNARILLPVFVLMTLPVGALVARRWFAASAFAVWAAWIGAKDFEGVSVLQQQGLYYTDTFWRGTQILGWLDEYDGDGPIYTNDPGFVVFHAGRAARFLPLVTQDIESFVEVWAERPGPIIWLALQRPDDRPPDDYRSILPVTADLDSPNVVVLVPATSGDPSLPSGAAIPQG